MSLRGGGNSTTLNATFEQLLAFASVHMLKPPTIQVLFAPVTAESIYTVTSE